TAISIPGLVGVLSGVARGRFSATINMAPANGDTLPNLAGWSAALLLRHVFETCDDYEDALRLLKREPAVFPTFVHLVGPAKGQAAGVAVYPQKQNRLHRFSGEPLAITNHYLEDLEYEDEDAKEDGQVYWTNTKRRLRLLLTLATKRA